MALNLKAGIIFNLLYFRVQTITGGHRFNLLASCTNQMVVVMKIKMI